ncbi:MAG: 6-phosphofructokinase [Bacillota bacterium]|nr:ATP-dependent 6-phosphofructokinase [Bacillota bacterium]NLU54975.1 ATP-dependent 6-phosphofructokinase [Bacillota bacterium]HOA91716.1 ATP-dependent 6-phosphofructokinase [Bacillota bacterium]HPQ10544.1 ATP-dependent 6-phosphofructokinase [Bacillota bacterium]HPZ73787.1 ATP-dependent 6-phosphofructokinase [Bacillota bacterium]
MQKDVKVKRIGVLTGGGDSSGINAVLHGICLEARNKGIDVVGILDGWKGLIEGAYMPLSFEKTVTYVNTAGTILGTSRTNPYKIEKTAEIIEQIKSQKLDGIIAIGGNDTLSVASRLADDFGLNIVGIPQTIDNDVPGTDYCVGFDTAVHNAVEAIHNVRATCDSHKEDIVVEVMGRDSGWIAAVAGLTAGAEFVFVPEMNFDANLLVDKLKARHAQGFLSNIIVIAEGVTEFAHAKIESGVDAFGNKMLSGIGFGLRDYLQEKLGKKTRAIVLSYIQRGGRPTSYEVFMDLNFGRTAVNLLVDGKTNLMVAYKQGTLQPVDLKLARGKQPVREDILKMVKELTL